FDIPPECREEMDRLRSDNNPARRFLLEFYQAGTGEFEKSKVYSHYRQWCETSGHDKRYALAAHTFGKEVVRTFRGAGESRPLVNGKRLHMYTGIRPHPEAEGYVEPEF